MLKRIFLILIISVVIVLFLNPNIYAEDSIRQILARSDLMMRSEKYLEVRRMLEESLQSHPDNIKILLRLGISQSMLRDYDAAEKTFKHALKIEPANPELLHNLGLMYLKQNKFKQAETYFRKTLSVREWHPETNYHLGFIFEKRGQRDKALEYYVKELNHNGKCAKAWQRYIMLKEQPEEERISTAEAITFALICVALSCSILWLRWSRK